MQLPPVPGAPLSPARATEVGAIPPPPPPPPPPHQPGAGRRTLLLAAGVVAVLIGGMWLAQHLEAPSARSVEAYARQIAAATGQEEIGIRVVRRQAAGRSATFDVEITSRRRNVPLFAPVLDPREQTSAAWSRTRGLPYQGSAGDLGGLDVAAWARMRELVTSADAAELRREAAISATELALLQTTVVREIAPPPVPANAVHYRPLVVHAQRAGLKWNLTHEEPSLSPAADAQPRPLEAFTGPVVVAGREEDRATLQALARLVADLEERFARAGDVVFERQRRAALASLHSGKLYAGTAESDYNRTARPRIFLELTDVRPDDDPPRVSAVLRNDGGWVETRQFSGILAASDSGAVQIKLSAAPEMDDGAAGPFLSDQSAPFTLDHDEDGDAVLPLTLAGGDLVWKQREASLRLRPVTEAERTELIRSLANSHVPLLEATQAGKVYRGTVTSKAKGTREEWILTFSFQEDISAADAEFGERPGIRLEAILENPARPKWRLPVGGDIAVNRYRSRGAMLELARLYEAETEAPEEAFDMFEDREGGGEFSGIPLRFEGGRLSGENARFIFRFEPASAEFVAARQKSAADRQAQLQAFIAAGAIHEATVERAGVDQPGGLILEFSAAEPPAALPAPGRPRRPGAPSATVPVAATLSSARHPHFALHFVGECDFQRATLRLRYRAPAEPPGGSLTESPELQKHFADMPHYYLQLALTLDGASATGEAVSSDRKVAVRVKASDPATADRLRAAQAARSSRMREFVRAGDVHDAVLDQAGASGGIRLRITEVDADGNVSALLHSPSSLRYAASLVGKLKPGGLQMEVKGFRGDLLGAAPDVPEAIANVVTYGSTVNFVAAEDTIVGVIAKPYNPDQVRLKFNVVPPGRRAQLRQAEAEAEARFRDFVAVGAIHEGTVSRGAGSKTGLVRLRVLKSGPEAEGFVAELSSASRPGFGVMVHGAIVPDLRLLRLETDGLGSYGSAERFESLEGEPELGSIFSGWREHDARMVLSCAEGRVRGTIAPQYAQQSTTVLTLDLQVSSPERSAQLRQEASARSAQLTGVVRPGAVLTGTSKRGTRSGPVRLRILQVESADTTAGRKFTAVLEPANLSEPSWNLDGWLAPERQRVRLQFTGAAETKERPSFARSPEQAQLPALWSTTITLLAEKNVLEGKLPNVEPLTALEFPLP